MRAKRNRQSGLALIMVLWFVALFTILALSFSQSMRNDTQVTANLIQAQRAKHLAEAAINRGIYGLVNQESAVADAVLTGNAISFDFQGAEISYRIEDENGKVDINQAQPELIANLLMSQEVDADTATAIADSVADWRDENDLRRLQGAEEAEYLAANMQRIPANAPFQSIAEVQQVLGMKPALYKRIRPYLTVHSVNEKINPRFAPRGVLQALPGIDETELEAFVSYRESITPENDAPAFPQLTGVESWLATESGPVYSIHGTASLASGAYAARKMIVWIHAREESTYYVLENTDAPLRPEPGDLTE